MGLFAAIAARTTDAGQPADDAGRVARAAAGDDGALAALYDAHAPAVYSLALRVVGDEADAEDVLQDVFSQAWRQAGRYDPRRGTVAAWLLNMTRTRAIDRLRARHARPDSRAAAPDDSWENLPARVVDPGDALAARRDAEQVRRALNDLPLLQRLAIELAYFEGLTQSEIADRLEQPLGTVKTRIRTGLLKLRDVLSGSHAGGTA
jgi:RNA polymerase sigma-70 factor (ECF subfamily)